MPRGLRRLQESGQTHFVTFSCYRRNAYFATDEAYSLFVQCLEDMRREFGLCVYGYVVMPEHVHLLLSEPPQGRLADAIHYLKLAFRSACGPIGQKTLERSGKNATTIGM